MKAVSKKLLKAIQSVGGKVQKTGYNSFSRYKYITESDINEAVLPALLEQGLLLTTSVESVTEVPASEDSKNRFASVVLVHKIIDTDSGEFLEFKSVGTGADTLDKAVYKALTGACKYFMMKLWMISGDDSDPENDSKTTPSKADMSSSNKPSSEKKGHFEKKAEKQVKAESPATVSRPNFSKFAVAKKAVEEEESEPAFEISEEDDPGF